MLAYVGPEVMLPVASAAAAILGGVLFAWRWIAGFFSRMWCAITGKRAADPDAADTTGTSAAPPSAAVHSVPPADAGRPAAPRQVSTPER